MLRPKCQNTYTGNLYARTTFPLAIRCVLGTQLVSVESGSVYALVCFTFPFGCSTLMLLFCLFAVVDAVRSAQLLSALVRSCTVSALAL